jgi:hypothetical protein
MKSTTGEGDVDNFFHLSLIKTFLLKELFYCIDDFVINQAGNSKLKLCSGAEAIDKFQKTGWRIARHKGSENCLLLSYQSSSR